MQRLESVVFVDNNLLPKKMQGTNSFASCLNSWVIPIKKALMQ